LLDAAQKTLFLFKTDHIVRIVYFFPASPSEEYTGLTNQGSVGSTQLSCTHYHFSWHNGAYVPIKRKTDVVLWLPCSDDAALGTLHEQNCAAHDGLLLVAII
jgi:hypothetical protein